MPTSLNEAFGNISDPTLREEMKTAFGGFSLALTTSSAAELNTLHGVTAGTITASKAWVGTTGGRIANGTSSVPIAAPAVASEFLALYTTQALSNSAYKTYVVRAECYLKTADAFASQGAGLYTIRGVAGVNSTYTFKGSANQGYLIGIQGKLDNKGVIGDNNSGGIYTCAMLAQVSGAGTFGTDAQLYGLWVDFQSGLGTPPTTTHMVNITNNSGKTIPNGIFMYGGNQVTNLLHFGTCGGAIGAATSITTSKFLTIAIDGVTHYVPCGTVKS